MRLPLSAQKILLKILNNYLRKSRLITKIIFGIKLKKTDRIHWDFTTVLLKNCLLHRIKSRKKVLEIGTGPYSILSIMLSNRTKCEVTACDINNEYIINAKKTAKQNRAAVSLLQSNLFENIKDTFDIIFFNTVYIPRQTGQDLGINELHDNTTDWCGGETGTETINRFLQDAHRHLRKNGEILLGFNPNYLSKKTLAGHCRSLNYNIKDTYKTFFNPCLVLIIEKK